VKAFRIKNITGRTGRLYGLIVALIGLASHGWKRWCHASCECWLHLLLFKLLPARKVSPYP